MPPLILTPQKISLLLRPLQSTLTHFTRAVNNPCPSNNINTSNGRSVAVSTNGHSSLKNGNGRKRNRQRNEASEEDEWEEGGKRKKARRNPNGGAKGKGSRGKVLSVEGGMVEVQSKEGRAVVAALKKILDACSVPQQQQQHQPEGASGGRGVIPSLSSLAARRLPTVILTTEPPPSRSILMSSSSMTNSLLTHPSNKDDDPPCSSDEESTKERSLDLAPWLERIPLKEWKQLVVGLAVEMVCRASLGLGLRERRRRKRVKRKGRVEWVIVLREVEGALRERGWKEEALSILSHLLSYPLLCEQSSPTSAKLSIFTIFPHLLPSLRSRYTSRQDCFQFAETVCRTCHDHPVDKIGPVVASLLKCDTELTLCLPFPLPPSLREDVEEALEGFPNCALDWAFENPQNITIKQFAVDCAVDAMRLDVICDLLAFGVSDLQDVLKDLGDTNIGEVLRILKHRNWNDIYSKVLASVGGQTLERSLSTMTDSAREDEEPTKSVADDVSEDEELVEHYLFKRSPRKTKNYMVVESDEENEPFPSDEENSHSSEHFEEDSTDHLPDHDDRDNSSDVSSSASPLQDQECHSVSLPLQSTMRDVINRTSSSTSNRPRERPPNISHHSPDKRPPMSSESDPLDLIKERRTVGATRKRFWRGRDSCVYPPSFSEDDELSLQ
ncbi:hypothetical protein BT69DRAFT_1355567 [Atractiella rhizophila]|nr:hypothetical protein BT69DRAFT_1355567 [Atractiella rhizophila]